MKKGFTLIELLTVIIVLGVLALVAMPQINKILAKSKRESVELSAKRYIDAVNNVLADQRMRRVTIIEDGINDIENLENVKVDGTMPNSGYVLVKDGIVKYVSLQINAYTVTCDLTGACTSTKGYFVYYKGVGSGLDDKDDGIEEYTNDKYVYLKYLYTGKKLQKPQLCFINDDLEYCLNNNDYEASQELLTKQFNKTECTETSDKTVCSNTDIEVEIRTNGYISSKDLEHRYTCLINSEDVISCSNY